MTVRRDIAQYSVPREAYLACDDTDTHIPPCALRFTSDEEEVAANPRWQQTRSWILRA